MPIRRSVALLVETSNGYSRGLLEGIVAYTKQRANWSIYLSEQERGAMPPKWLNAWKGDGIIARVETAEIGNRLKKFEVPIVDLSATRHLPSAPWADTDDQSIARLAFEHFKERGFKYFAYCGDPGFAWSVARCACFKQLVQQSGIDFFEHEAIARYDSKYSWDREKKRLAFWLRSLPRPTAIMACYDFKAQEVLDVCRELQIAVPEEIAVLGVDDDQLLCELAEPPLSSIIPDTQKTGFEAALLLDRMMDGEKVAIDQPLLTKPLGIQIRASTDILAIEDREIASALRYIRLHANENIRVTDILKEIPLSRRVFEARFRKALGRTPHDEIQRIRIQRVKELLQSTDLSIGQIALRTGFEHAEYLAAAFKREAKLSPSEYRREHAI
jgi:LacI family transcriptional regulator